MTKDADVDGWNPEKSVILAGDTRCCDCDGRMDFVLMGCLQVQFVEALRGVVIQLLDGWMLSKTKLRSMQMMQIDVFSFLLQSSLKLRC